MSQRALLKIGQVAEQSGVSIDAIRYYERLGLLPVAPRTRGGFRLYSREQVERLQAIRQAQSFGLSLKEIRQVVNPATARHGRAHCASVHAILDVRLREIDLRLAELQKLRVDVALARERCAATLRDEAASSCPVVKDFGSHSREMQSDG
jgi:DNA-binding transcriptional MerR regulator